MGVLEKTHMRKYNLLLALFTSVIAFSLTACEETVDPILDSDRQFTLWGTLDMNADTQFIRVVPIREVLDVRTAQIPPIDVLSIDLDTGETVVWRDSLITFSNAAPAILFSADLRVQPMHTYRIEVRSPDASYVTTAETTIPALPFAEVFEEDVEQSIGASGFFVDGWQDVTWHGINQTPYSIEQWYRFLEFGGYGFIDHMLSYVPPNSYEANRDELTLKLNLSRQRDSVQKYVNLSQVRLVGLGQTLTVLDNQFAPPGGEFDAELLAQPGTMSNVEHGFGFIGSVGRFSVEWVISDESARFLNYTPLSGASAQAVIGKERLVASLKSRPWMDQ